MGADACDFAVQRCLSSLTSAPPVAKKGRFPMNCFGLRCRSFTDHTGRTVGNRGQKGCQVFHACLTHQCLGHSAIARRRVYLSNDPL